MKNLYPLLSLLIILLLSETDVPAQKRCRWLGKVSSAWNDPGNWSCGEVPNSNTVNVTIAQTANQPVISRGETFSVRNLQINNAAFLTNNGTLQIAGSTGNSGEINSESGTIVLNGDGMQNIRSAIYTNGVIMALIIDNTSRVTLSDSLKISGSLTVNSGNFDLRNNSLTFLSTAANTARFGPLGGSLSNDDHVTVQRFIPSERRAYRILAPSVNTTTSVNANWQEGVHNTVFGVNIDPHPGFGIQITGAGGAANSFDQTASNESSMFTFICDCTVPWAAVPNTNMALDGKTGYLVFVRGNRSTDMTSTADPLPTSATTLRATGKLLTGAQTYNNLNDTGFSLIANPYASPVNWHDIYFDNNTSHFENYYTYWDPTIGERGGYVTVNVDGVNSAGTNATVEIQSGLAFFVKGMNQDGQPHNLVIQESDKSTTGNINVFKPARVEGRLNVRLFYDEKDGTHRLADGVAAIFSDKYSTGLDANDAQDISNWDENIAWSVSNKHLSIQSLPLPKGSGILPLYISHLKERSYQFEIASNLSYPGTIELADNYTSTRTLIGPELTTASFPVTADAASKASDRFSIVFRPVIPVATETRATLRIYPNPVEGNMVHVELNNMEKGVYYITITNSSGQEIYTKKVEHPGGPLLQSIDIGKLGSGLFHLSVGTMNSEFIKN
jgi:hypothetical protein